ncbi:MAG TPA: thioredoxin domain-containing protein [Anaerolineales bacterium]|nr:thioredoxin domain-containing protein [Anaerolineales bacterium]
MSEEENIQLESPKVDKDAGKFNFTRRSLYSALLPVAFVTGLAAGYLFWGRDPVPPTNPDAPGSLEEPTRFDVSVDDDPALGPEDAPITIVEFSDFRCPYCKVFHVETFEVLMAKYPNQIHFVYRDFPVVGGRDAALASECAHEQGAYWEFHDLLFSGEYPNLDRDTFAAYAEKLDLDVEDFLACVDEERYGDEVDADARYAAGLGITGTPTFFINGIPMVGAQPLDAFVQVIEYELGE